MNETESAEVSRNSAASELERGCGTEYILVIPNLGLTEIAIAMCQPNICSADRVVSSAARDAARCYNMALASPFGDERLPKDGEPLNWRNAFFAGMSEHEKMDEVRRVVGLDGELSLTEATEGVRRILLFMDPWLTAQASEHDCVGIASSLLDALGSRATHVSRLAETSRQFLPWLEPALPNPPRWLEYTQLGVYRASRNLFHFLGLRSRCSSTDAQCLLHWWDSEHTPHGGDPTPLILIHGMFTTGASMALLALHLQRRRRVLVIDLPGFDYSYSVPHDDAATTTATATTTADGASVQGEARPISLERCVRAVSWLINYLTPPTARGTRGQVDLLAHSFGANVAMVCAASHGESIVRHVHLIAPGGASANLFSQMTRVFNFHSIGPPLLRPLVVPILFGIFASPNQRNLVHEQSYVTTVRRPHAGAKPAVTQPCNLIFGSDDDLVTPRPASALARSYPRGEAKLLRRAVHQLNVLNAATLAGIIDDFALRHGGGGDDSVVGRTFSGGVWRAALRAFSLVMDWLMGVRVEAMHLRP